MTSAATLGTMNNVESIVVSDAEWDEYNAAAANREIRVRFANSSEDTRLWRNAAGELVCDHEGQVVPVIRYSAVASDANVEAVSESAIFMMKLIRGGIPMEIALDLTNRLYRVRDHSAPIPDAVVNRLLETFRNGDVRGI